MQYAIKFIHDNMIVILFMLSRVRKTLKG